MGFLQTNKSLSYFAEITGSVGRGSTLFFKALLKRKRAFAGFLILMVIYVIPALLVVVDVVPRLPPAKSGWENIYAPPTLQDFPWYILGTEFTGRPLLLCIVRGIPYALAIAFLAGLITVVVGLVLGLVSGYVGGISDTLINIVIDVALSIPSIFLALIFATVLPTELKREPLVIAAILSITAWAGLARSIRAQVLALKRTDAILISKLIGFSTAKIVFGEIMWYIMPYIFMSFIMAVVNAITGYFGIAFLGLFPIDVTNWTMQINQALSYLGALGLIRGGKALLGFWAPTIMILLLQLSLIYLSEIVEELFNPVLRIKLLREIEKR